MSKIETVTLYRPVSLEELDLIRQSEFHAFPPRPPGYPFFYSILARSRAIRIARDLSAKTSRSVCVTRLRVRKSFLDGYETRNVGTPPGREYWIPAENLPALNENIVGLIEVMASFP